MEWKLRPIDPRRSTHGQAFRGLGATPPGKIFFLARLAHSCETDFRVLGFYVVWLPRFLI